MRDGQPKVSVVIPTTGRPSLLAAVESALAQTYPPDEVIVVYDLDRVPDTPPSDHPTVRVAHTGGSRGANAARRLGIDLARGDAIALLDDDDRWLPTKLEEQIPLLVRTRGAGQLAVVGAAMRVEDEGGREVRTMPRRPIRPGQPVADYLFTRREVPYGEATLNSSSLLIDRALFDAVPLDERLPLHQDWDWLLRADREGSVRFAMVPTPQLVYRQQPRGRALSRPRRWRSSLDWVDGQRHLLSPRQYGDFVLGVTVPMAVDAGDRKGALAAGWRSIRRGRPGRAAVIVAAASLALPRGAVAPLSRLMRTLAGERG